MKIWVFVFQIISDLAVFRIFLSANIIEIALKFFEIGTEVLLFGDRPIDQTVRQLPSVETALGAMGFDLGAFKNFGGVPAGDDFIETIREKTLRPLLVVLKSCGFFPCVDPGIG